MEPTPSCPERLGGEEREEEGGTLDPCRLPKPPSREVRRSLESLRATHELLPG